MTIMERRETFELSSNETFLLVATLSPYRMYLCKITAATSVGVGPYSSQLTLYTPQDGKY